MDEELVEAPIAGFAADDPRKPEPLGELALRVVAESLDRIGGATVLTELPEAELVIPLDAGEPEEDRPEELEPGGLEITVPEAGATLDRTEPDPALDGTLTGPEPPRGADMAPDELDDRPEETDPPEPRPEDALPAECPPELRPEDTLPPDCPPECPPDFPPPPPPFWAASIRGVEQNRTAVRIAARFARLAIRIFMPSRPLAGPGRLLCNTMIGTLG